jgi:hypothetical protein
MPRHARAAAWLALTLAACAACAACAASPSTTAPTAPAASPPLSATQLASAPPHTAPPAKAAPKLGLVNEGDPSPTAAPAAAPTVAPTNAPANAPGPLERAFERVALPPDAPQIVAIDGRHERDVWLLGTGGQEATIFRWDGAKIVKDKGPQCKPSGRYWGLVLVPDAAIALATSLEIEGEVRIEARRPSRGGGWSCEKRYNEQLLMVGPALLRLESRTTLTLSGHRLPLPSLGAIGGMQAEIAARSPADLWLYFPSQGDALHGNGVGWESRPTGLAAVKSLRTDDSGAAWLVGGNDQHGEGDVVLRWDTATHAWKRLPTPADLRAARIRVASERDVWLIGKEHVHHWDGASLRRGKTPIQHVDGAWISAAGELWIVGGDASRATPGRSTTGAAFRVPAMRKP